MNASSKKIKALHIVGTLFVMCGLVLNPLFIGRFLSFGGRLALIDTILIFVFDAICVVVGLLVIRFRKDIAIQLVGKNVLLFLGTLLFLLVLSEIGARVFDRLHGYDFLSNKERAEKPIIPFRMFGPDFYAEENGTRYIVGRWGERYPLTKNSNTFRIVAFGGSTTQNLVGKEHYPLVLEKLLQERYPKKHIEVINVGNSGYSTPHFITLLSLDVLSWDPDLVIMSENVNDLLAAYFPNFAFDYSNKYSAQSFLPTDSLAHKLFGWSRFYWVLQSRVEALTYRLDDARGGIYQRRSYGNEPPKDAEEVFKRNLLTFVAIAKSRSIPVILASQPLETSEEYWDRHMKYKEYNNIVTYPLHKEFVAHHHRYNKIIQDVARETHSYFVDNDALFAGDKKYFADFVHYTKLGVEQLAKNYFDYIVSRGIIR